MTTIGIRELRQHASKYVAMVGSGQTVNVTSRGKLVALMQPAGEARSERDRLVAEGLLRPASQPTGRMRSPRPIPARPGEPTNAQLLHEQRADRV